MRQNPEVSVIVPIYNMEKLLGRCVDSILAQTFEKFEIILVDDGSKDGSRVLCERYARNDSRVKVVRKENGGVASARQAGLDTATGTYIIHADPDDWVEPDMLEQMVAVAKERDADMVISDYYRDYGKTIEYVSQCPSKEDYYTVISELFSHLHGSCWNKLIKAEYCKKESFIAGLNLSEDLLYVCKVLMHKPKIVYCDKAFYHYIFNGGGSESRFFSAARFEQLMGAFDELNKLFIVDQTLQKVMFRKTVPYLASVGLCASDLASKRYREILHPYRNYLLTNTFQSLKRRILIQFALRINKRLAYKIYSMLS